MRRYALGVLLTRLDRRGAGPDVRDRLQRKFSHVHASEVERTVDQAHSEFDGHPIRDFVPILVERAATDRLTRIPRQRASSTA